MISPSKSFMALAIEEALKAKEEGDYAVGAVIVKDDEIIASAGNRIKLDKDPTHHAEIVAIRKACKAFDHRHLEGCVLYTTHEPCPMCASAAVWARMKGIVFGANMADMSAFRNQKGNGDWSWRTIDLDSSKLLELSNPKLDLVPNFMRDDCCKLFHDK